MFCFSHYICSLFVCMHLRNRILVSLLILAIQGLNAQSTLIDPDLPEQQILDRWSILFPEYLTFHPNIKGIPSQDAVALAFQIDTVASMKSALNQYDLRQIYLNHNEWLSGVDSADHHLKSESSPKYNRLPHPILRHFYSTPGNLWEINRPGLYIKVNPLLRVGIGLESRDSGTYYLNQRGVNIRGGIDDRLYFSGTLLESQARFPYFLRSYIDKYNALPGNGLYKVFKSRFSERTDAIDYLNSTGYTGFRITKHVNARFGYGQHVLGDGYRSMVLSNWANNYLYFQLNTRIWKFHYQNIWAELAGPRIAGNVLVSKRYMAAHYLSFYPTKNIRLGLFESVIFNRTTGFELHYLNPIILYRAVEQHLGSPDNVLIGLDGSINLWKQVKLYGQLMLDEFILKELFIERRGYWANKYGIQAGLHWVNAGGIDHLDVRVEYNSARPYTYSHFDSIGNYVHGGLPLAHPLGANFRELLGIVTWKPAPRWSLQWRSFGQWYGTDRGLAANWGNNPNLPYTYRVNEFGNKTGQGVKTQVYFSSFEVNWALFHQFWLDFQAVWRNQQGADPFMQRYFQVGLRWNMGPLRQEI